jgi:hypothetical protein
MHPAIRPPAATRGRALSIAEIADHAFELNGAPANRKQRLSATRAAHRVVKRVRESDERRDRLMAEAHTQTKAALGRERRPPRYDAAADAYISDTEYDTLLAGLPAWRESKKLFEYFWRIGIWPRFLQGESPGTVRSEDDHWSTSTKDGRLYFHPPDVPIEVWAVAIDKTGVHWFDAEVIRVTERNVMVRYRDVVARLDRERLWRSWARWRGVQFVSSRTGRIAKALDEIWWRRYGATGGAPPVMQMPLAEAMVLLGVPQNYTRDDVIAAFRRAVKKAHPDMGGTAEMFASWSKPATGCSCPRHLGATTKMPAYYASGTTILYRSSRGGSRQRLGQTRRLAYG